MSLLRRAAAELPIVAALIAGSWLLTVPGSATCLTILTLWVWGDPIVQHVWRRREVAASPEVQPGRDRGRRSGRICRGVDADEHGKLHQKTTDTEPGDHRYRR